MVPGGAFPDASPGLGTARSRGAALELLTGRSWAFHPRGPPEGEQSTQHQPEWRDSGRCRSALSIEVEVLYSGVVVQALSIWFSFLSWLRKFWKEGCQRQGYLAALLVLGVRKGNMGGRH